MLLIYDAGRDLYVGDVFTVTPDAYDAAVDELVEGGAHEGAARALLLDESEWSAAIEGVVLIPGPRLCLQCRQPLDGERTQFCDVLCEAGFFVETHT